MNVFPRGSEWRKWDLHAHTPFTRLNDGYSSKSGDVWDEFCDKVERSDVDVFGITDYFSVENYRTLKKKFYTKYPKSKKVFFPNVELRVDRSSNNRNEGYDLHLIFDNEISDDKLQEFLQNLQLDNTEDGTGKKIKANELKSAESFKTAYTTIPLIDKALEDTFGDKKPYFKVLMAHGHGGMQPEKNDSRKGAVAEETDKRVADIYFGCDEKDRDFFLSDRGKVKKKKPCVTGSDAHSFKDFEDRVGKQFKVNERYTLPTWIKADKTFEGLRQITHEPRERVFLGEKPEKLIDVEGNRARFVDSIEIGHKDASQTSGWFNDKIQLNPALVAIIGRKGQGKSALADIIGFCGRTKISPSDFSFLHKDKFRKKGLAKDYQATLTWLDGTSIIENLDSDVNVADVEKIKYLPQKYVETICNEEGVSPQFQKEINKVIFSYIPDESRLNTANLADLISVRTMAIDARLAKLRSDLHATNENIVKLESKRRPQYLESLKGKLDAKKQELNALVKPKAVPAPKGKLKKADQKKLDKVLADIEANSKAIGDAKSSLKSVNEKIQKLTELESAVARLSENADSIVKKYADTARLLSIDLSKLISVKIDSKILEKKRGKLTSEKNRLEELLDEPVEHASPKSLYVRKESLEAQKDRLVNALGEDQQKYAAYQERLKAYNARRKEIEGKPNDQTLETIKSIEKEIKYLGKKIVVDLKTAQSDRDSLVGKIYSELGQKADFYKEIYRPLQRFIDAEKKTQEKSGSKLGFDADVVFEKTSFHAGFLDRINQNRDGSFQYTGNGQKVLSKITEKVDASTATGVKAFIQELIDHLEFDKTKTPEKENSIYSQLKGKEPEYVAFYDYVFGLEYLDVKYKVLFNGKDLNSNEFSPGEKGALLLIFYLLIDKDRIPLIMDQPEENLDNESIFELLVPYIKRAKLRRQIIIVTHNPNLAVVCDAEQVVAAAMKKLKNQIRYTFGSIENPEMNKKASDVLEGTLPAFDIRDKKYIRD